MYRFVRLVVIGALALLAGACNESTPVAGTVALVDMDQLARSLNQDQVVARQVVAFRSREQERLEALRTQLNKGIQDEKAKLGDKPTDQAKADFDKLLRDSEQRLRKETAQVQEQTRALQVKLVHRFRAQVEPVASELARARHFSMVLIKKNDTLYLDPAVDLTEAVRAKLAVGMASTAAPGAPQASNTDTK